MNLARTGAFLEICNRKKQWEAADTPFLLSPLVLVAPSSVFTFIIQEWQECPAPDIRAAGVWEGLP